MPLDPITGGESLVQTVVATVGSILDRVIPDRAAAEKAKAEMQLKLVDVMANSVHDQTEVNKVEAANPNIFVSGWRPAVGWVCAAGFAWAFVVGPCFAMVIRVWKLDYVLPVIDTGSLLTMLGGMLGLGVLKTVERVTGNEPSATGIVTTNTTVRKATAV